MEINATEIGQSAQSTRARKLITNGLVTFREKSTQFATRLQAFPLL